MLKRSVIYQGQRYVVVLEPEDDGGYAASVPAVPGAYSDGDTEAEALENIADAIAILKESAEEAGSILSKQESVNRLDTVVPVQSSNAGAVAN